MAFVRNHLGAGVLTCTLAALLLAPAFASANTITVNDPSDPSTGNCTLHDAITAANTNAPVNGCAAGSASGTDLIDFNLPDPSTITLAGGLPNITTNIDIQGPGSASLTVSGADQFRPFTYTSGAAIGSISGMTITHGFTAAGGAILEAGTLTLTDVTVTGNHATVTNGVNAFAEGGGIRSTGTLHLVLSSVSNNVSTASGATAQNSAAGGGIFTNGGIVTLDRSTVSGNQLIATAPGGAATASAIGAGIADNGQVTATESTISGNTITVSGGVTNSGQGGGISMQNGAGIKLTLDRSTVTGNSVSVAAPVSTAKDGGILSAGLASSALTLTSSTISGNSAPSLSNLEFGAVTNSIKNTIISNPLGGGANCSGGGTGSQGFNLEDTNTCGFNQPGDQPNTDPMLDVLGNNGGPTQTMALLTGSPAIDAGLSSLGEVIDQRGRARPVDVPDVADAAGSDGTDIGAFEVQPPPPSGGGGSGNPPATTPPSTTPPATVTPTKKRCKKGRVRKHGKCVKKKRKS